MKNGCNTTNFHFRFGKFKVVDLIEDIYNAEAYEAIDDVVSVAESIEKERYEGDLMENIYNAETCGKVVSINNWC